MKQSYIRNLLYGVSLLWTCSPKRVVHIALQQIARYFEWLFYSVYFMRYIIESMESGLSFEKLTSMVLLFAVVFCTLGLYGSYYRTSVIVLTDTVIHQKLYAKLYAKAANVELACYENPEFYSKYTMAINGAAEKLIACTTSFFEIIFGVVASAIAFYAILSIDPWMGFFVLAPLLGNFLFGRIQAKINYKRDMDDVKNVRKAAYVNRVMYLADYAKEIRYTNIYKLMMDKFTIATGDSMRVIKHHSKKASWSMWFRNILTFHIFFEGVTCYAAFRCMVSGSIGLGDLTIVFTAMTATSWIMIGLFDAVNTAMQNGVMVGYLKNFLDYEATIPEDQGGILPSTQIDSIEFRDVSFAYQEGKPMISHVSFRVYGAKTVALVGHNGAGKTTLIKLLLRLYDPTEGEILLNGVNIKKYNLKAYRDLFGVAFQDYKMMAFSLRENILMGNRPGDETQVVNSALQKAGVYERVLRFENGLDANLTKEFDAAGEALSGGETQKIVVARAFAKEASILLFDEPSSALDPIAEYELYESIRKERGGHMVFFISHRLSSVKDSDVVWMLQNGEIIESGTHETLMKQKGVYADMYQKQAVNYLALEKEGA
ncbi:MAG: ABC transporter ATP-binding protein/permease [Lachnospiraceae bacterium]|nr:ABC transporter ATP-binding protein/permease [Lachnospiraceae bacterium]